MSGIEVNKRNDIFPPAVIIDSVSVVGRIQKEFFNAEPGKINFHGEKGMEEGKHIMPGSPLQKRKYRKVIAGIGSHIHVEMVTEEIAFAVGVPPPAAVGLGIMTFAVTGRTAFLLTIADALFALLCGSTDRSAVTGKSQVVGIDQPPVDGLVQELLLIKPEDKEEGVLWF